MTIKQNIPNFITLCNAASGCVGIVFASEGNLAAGAFMVFVAAFFDFFDGLFARLLKSTSAIGKQLDSLSDLISFGLLPSYLLYKIYILNIGEDISVMDLGFLRYIPFFIVLFSAVRLAKFNVDEGQEYSFSGLATPANAVFLTSLVLIYSYNPENLLTAMLHDNVMIIVLSLFLSLSLVLPIKLMAFKFKTYGFSENRYKFSFIVVAVVFFILYQYQAIPWLTLLYFIVSFVNYYLDKKTMNSSN